MNERRLMCQVDFNNFLVWVVDHIICSISEFLWMGERFLNCLEITVKNI